MGENVIFWWLAGIALVFAAFWAFMIPKRGASAGYMIGAFLSFTGASSTLAVNGPIWLVILFGVVALLCLVLDLGARRQQELDKANRAKKMPDSRAGESNVLDLGGFQTKPGKKPKDD
ncbi:MAG: hypothetical protein MUC92_10865 [Fimbriimonadaceae bacterium]|nr:hypothetical protein [Fimbriimonadaceae bacterium]